MRRLDEVAAGEFPVELDAAVMETLRVRMAELADATPPSDLADEADDSCDPYWHRAAFDRIDTDGSGFIETPEVEQLPPFDTSTFLSLVDTDNDGKISFQEFDSFVD